MEDFNQIKKKRQMVNLQAEIDYNDFKLAYLDQCLHRLNQQSIGEIKQGEIFFKLLLAKKPVIAKTIKGTLYDPSSSKTLNSNVDKKVLELWKRLPEYLDKRVV